MTFWPVDYCFEQFKGHLGTIQAAAGSNEAGTRLRAIDTILFDVLGWDKTKVDPERYCRLGYADYVFHSDAATPLVLEAKRNEVAFVLGGRPFPDEPVGFGLVAEESSRAADAMVQSLGYAAKLGARFVAISNGSQWLITLTYVANRAIDQRTVYVFESLDAIQSRFATFHRCFGPEGVYSNAIADDLAENRRVPAPAKLSTQIPAYPEPLDRNSLCNEIDYVLDYFWDTTRQYEDAAQFLDECYILPEPAVGSMELIRELLLQRQAVDQRAVAVDETKVTVTGADAATDLIKSYVSDKPLLVLGRVGHGKSTFLRHLRLIGAKKELTNYVQLVVDFLDRPNSAEEVEQYIFEQIDKQLLERFGMDIREAAFVRAALDGELRRFRKTPRGNRFAQDSEDAQDAELEFIESIVHKRYVYYTHMIKHLKRSHRASIAVFLDNLDRRVDDKLQEQAFIQASAMARDWEALVFICLRPGTYFRSVQTGILDSVAPKIINIVPPRVSILLRKRFLFAAKLAEGNQPSGVDASVHSRSLTAELPTAAMFFKCCAESFFQRKDTCYIFEAACNGDMRALLRYVRDFITAKHLDTRKIIAKIDDDYLIPPHEALRALLYGDYWHYDPARSVFVNLFDIEHCDPREHFARLLSLNFLERISEGGATHGFCRSGELTAYLLQLGFSKAFSHSVIEGLRTTRCIEEKREGTLWAHGEDEEVRVTRLGRYQAGELVKTFQYIDAVIVDTPIVDDKARAVISDARSIDDRIARAELFVEYLDAAANGLEAPEAQRVWQDVSDAIKRDIEGVRANVERRRLKR